MFPFHVLRNYKIAPSFSYFIVIDSVNDVIAHFESIHGSYLLAFN